MRLALIKTSTAFRRVDDANILSWVDVGRSPIRAFVKSLQG